MFLFIHSSADRHLGCLQILAIMNKSAMDIHVEVTENIIIFHGYLEEKLLSGMVKACLIL